MRQDFREEVLKLKITKLVDAEVETHCLKIRNLAIEGGIRVSQRDS